MIAGVEEARIRFHLMFATRRANRQNKLRDKMATKYRDQDISASKANKTVERLKRKLHQNLKKSPITQKNLESDLYRNNTTMNGNTKTHILRGIRQIRISIDDTTGDPDLSPLRSLSEEEIAMITGYLFVGISPGRGTNIIQDVGKTHHAFARRVDDHWKGKLRKAARCWKKEKGQYPKSMEIIFFGGHDIPSKVVSDMEKALGKRAYELNPKLVISGKNTGPDLETLAWPNWAIAGVYNLGAPSHSPGIKFPSCRGPNEQKIADNIQKLFTHRQKTRK